MSAGTKIVLCCVLTWINSVIGCTIGLLTRDWGAALWAFNAAFCAAGWWVATKHWAMWQVVAHQALEELERRQ